MKFELLLYGFYRIFRYTSGRQPDFKEKIREKDITLVIKTKDGKRGRSFTFKDGKVFSKRGVGGEPVFSLVWITASDGSRIMTDMVKGKSKALMDAVSNGQLLLEGNAGMVMWFLGIMNKMMKYYSKKPSGKTSGQPQPEKD